MSSSHSSSQARIVVRPPQGMNLTLDDIYHLLFRQKWKVLALVSLGVLIALLLPLLWRLPYQSEAKLFVRYIEPPNPVGTGDPRTTVGSSDSAINTELEILTSLDLAGEVAQAVGPAKILAKSGGGSDRASAAAVVHANLQAEVPKNTSVIRLVFRHPDAAVVQPILDQLIQSYLKKHAETHGAVRELDEFLTRRTDDLRSRRLQLQDELRNAEAKAGVLSLDDSKKAFTEEISGIRKTISATEAELAERNEMVLLQHPGSVTQTNPPSETNLASALVPPDKVSEYRKICKVLEALRTEEQKLVVQFTPGSTMLKPIEDQLEQNERAKEELETNYPGLITAAAAQSKADAGSELLVSRATELARISALQAKIRVLTNQLSSLRTNAASVNAAEGSISQLKLELELVQAQFKTFSSILEESHIKELLAAVHFSNITTIQSPSPPFQDNRKLQKVRGIALFGCIAAALGLAILLEVILDRSLKRASEIEPKLGLPLLITIPNLNGKRRLLNGKHRFIGNGKAPSPPKPDPETTADAPLVNGTESPVPATNGHSMAASNSASSPVSAALVPFAEALRDRLITLFEIKNLTHKPKLVAVTSCGRGSGVTSIAAGLAASLSETGDGNVLLVDMNDHHGTAHHFNKGRLTLGIDDALEASKRDPALVQDNLYVVSAAAGKDQLPRILPKRFNHLVPRLRASDYDYIIFDLPAISQISITPRLTRFMDFTLLVIESEKSELDLVKRGIGMLTDPTNNVGVVLNKRNKYVPRLLQQEL